VHFMAESAAVLAAKGQAVCLPNIAAGCAMADMADATDVSAALEEMDRLAGGGVVPVTYVNSTAELKAVTARAGGACCTSSNAKNVFAWALQPTDQGGAGGGRCSRSPMSTWAATSPSAWATSRTTAWCTIRTGRPAG